MAADNQRVWLITGASSGFGRAIAEAALAAGDIVVAAARRPDAWPIWSSRPPTGSPRCSSTSPTRTASPPPSTRCSTDTVASMCW